MSKPQVLETREELYALPAGVFLRSDDEHHRADYWLTKGDYLGDCISAGDYSGPLTEVSLPAVILQVPIT